MYRIRPWRGCTAAVLALALAGTASADDEPDPRWLTPRAEATRTAVLDWCEARGGKFWLGGPHDLAPICLASDPDLAVPVVFLGMWEDWVPFDRAWWWQRRAADNPEYRVGVLWLVDPTNPAYDMGRTSGVPGVDLDPTLDNECDLAGAAVMNPAKVPVRLVGPSADECSDLEVRGEIAHEVDKALREHFEDKRARELEE